MKDWTGSKVEEAISLLDLICYLLARSQGLRVWVIIFLIKAGWDVVCAIGLGIIEVLNEKRREV
jgi:hypothetical protein